MITYRVFNINYSIEPEDIIYINEDDYALRSDYIQACEDEVNSIIDDLPTEIEVKIDDDFDGDLDDELSDAISDVTGWLVEGFDYEKLKTSDKRHAQIMSKHELETEAEI